MPVAVVGAGAWGLNHVRTAQSVDGLRLAHVCDERDDVLHRVRSLAPSVPVTRDLQHVLDDPDVRGVIVATPAATHAAVAERVLRSGKDVLVEKPLALLGADAHMLVELAEQLKRVLMVGHLLLFHPAVAKLKELIGAGHLGDVLYITSQRLNLGVVRQVENAWWSLAPHDVSLVEHLLDGQPESISATAACFLQPKLRVEDVAFASLQYKDGRTAHVHVSWLDPHKTRRLKVVGTQRMAVFDDGVATEKLTIYDKGVEPPPAAVSYADSIRIRTGDIWIPAIKMQEPLALEQAAFVQAMRTRRVPLAHGHSGVRVVRVLEAGAASMAAHGAPMELDG